MKRGARLTQCVVLYFCMGGFFGLRGGGNGSEKLYGRNLVREKREGEQSSEEKRGSAGVPPFGLALLRQNHRARPKQLQGPHILA